MLGLGLSIGDVATYGPQVQRGIPLPYITESGDQYVSEDGSNSYTTEG